MAVEIKIKNRGLKIEDFVDEESGAYGIHDEHYRLAFEEVGNPLVLYNEEKLERGFEVYLEEDVIFLSQPLPTGTEDIRFFYGYVVKLLKTLGISEFERNEEPGDLAEIESYIAEDIAASTNALDFMAEKIQEDGEELYIFALMNPISIGEKTVEGFGGDLDAFADYLDRVQSIDYFYATPLLYRNNEDESIMGSFVISPDVVTVLPKSPVVFNNEITVDQWFAAFYLEGENIFDTMLPYDKFLALADMSEAYDDGHFMVNYSEEEIRKILDTVK